MSHLGSIIAITTCTFLSARIDGFRDDSTSHQRFASQGSAGSLHFKSAVEHDDELQLLQLQSAVLKGKQREEKRSPEASFASPPQGLLAQYDGPFGHASFSKLHQAIQSLDAVKAWARSSMAAQLVFGFNGRYCERRFGGLLNHHDHDGNHGPEILNTITSAFIVFVGVYEIAFWNHQSAFIRLLCAMVIINGWSAAVRHYADVPFCAVLDGITMVIGAVLGCCYLVDLVTQRMKDQFKIIVLRVSAWAGVPLLFCLCFIRSPHSFDPHTSSSAFRFMFAFPLIGVAMVVYGSLWRNWVTWDSVDNEALANVKYHLLVGVPLCCLGALCLGASELFCDDSPLAQYFPGHALWHLLFPFGVNALLLYLCALWADTNHQPLHFYKGGGWKGTVCKIAPAFSLGELQ